MEESLGKIIDSRLLTVSFFEAYKMEVKTEKAVLVIIPPPLIPIGKEAFVEKKIMAGMYFSWEGSKFAYLVKDLS